MSTLKFPCPFCTSDISSEAVSCPQCQRDVSGVRLLSIRLQQLHHRVDDLERRLDVEEASVMTDQASVSYTLPQGIVPAVDFYRLRRPVWVIVSIVAAVVVVLLSHWLMLFVLETSSIALRIVTIVVPMIIGLFGAILSRETVLTFVSAGFFVAVVCVVGMLGITARIDGVEWFPTTHRDQWEVLEYVAAIWLGFSTGFFVQIAIQTFRRMSNENTSARPGPTHDLTNASGKVKAISGKLEGLFAALTPVVSAVAALYSGLRPFFD